MAQTRSRAGAVKQITLHFTRDTEYIIDTVRKLAKADMRTAEQEMVYILSKVVRPQRPSEGVEAQGDPVVCHDCAEAVEAAPRSSDAVSGTEG